MRRSVRLPLAVLIAMAGCGAASARESLGVFEGWAVFRDGAAGRCYAIAEPARRPRGASPSARPFAAVGTWPGAGRRGQLHFRLSRVKRKGAPAWLAIGGQRVLLASGGWNAWAADPRADAAIVALMRGGSSMSVEAVDAAGRPFADTYRLRGAATAIDAAALGCAG